MNILFLFAHMDDEAFGPAGTIAKLALTNNVTVVSLCKGDRPGNEEVMSSRAIAFKQSCEFLGADLLCYTSSDLRLDYFDAMRDAEAAINFIKPEAVYTHNASDLHRDHRLVAEVALAICRPTPESAVRELYMCELISSTSWAFDQLGPSFIPNTYVDVSDAMEAKREVLNYYETELREHPDARSVEAMEILSKYRGTQSGVQNAEAFKQVFCLR